MNGYEKYAEFFLKNQQSMFGRQVAGTIDEAVEFLEDSMAQIFDDIAELKEYWEEMGMDMEGMTDEELLDPAEVMKLPDGKLLLI